jgi:hypothetical protein
MSLTELLYGTSSYHAIAKPGEFFLLALCRVGIGFHEALAPYATP